MSYPIYYVEAGDTLPHLFGSYDGGTGASITLTGLAVTDIEIYKDGGVTTRASDSGYALLGTDGIDEFGTGIHGFSINLADNSDAGFYAVGSWYHVVIASVTVDGQTVNFVAFAFRIVSATRGMAGTALPDAAADAAGGLPISDAGGLDLDALPTSNEIADQVWDEVLTGNSHNDPTSAGKRLRQLAGFVEHSGMAVTGTANTITLDGDASAVDNIYSGELVSIIDGTGVGQSRVIISYDGLNQIATINRVWTVIPAVDSEFVILSYAIPMALDYGMVVAATDSSVTLENDAPGTNNALNGLKIVIIGGTGYGQGRIITSYTGATRLAGINENWSTNPDTTSLYLILPTGRAFTVGKLDTLGLSTQEQTDVNTQVLDVLNTDTFAEPTGVPGATTTLATKLGYLFMSLRNRISVSSTKKIFYDDGDTAEWEKDLTDDGTTYNESEGNAP
jgi:hypothetical protein